MAIGLVVDVYIVFAMRGRPEGSEWVVLGWTVEMNLGEGTDEV